MLQWMALFAASPSCNILIRPVLSHNILRYFRLQCEATFSPKLLDFIEGIPSHSHNNKCCTLSIEMSSDTFTASFHSEALNDEKDLQFCSTRTA